MDGRYGYTASLRDVTDLVTDCIMATTNQSDNLGAAVHPLVAHRKEHKLTQRALAAQLDVARETVARWETGRKIDDDLLPRVSERTGIARSVLRPDLVLLLGAEPAE